MISVVLKYVRTAKGRSVPFCYQGRVYLAFFAAYLRLGFFPLSESVNYEHKVLSGGN